MDLIFWLDVTGMQYADERMMYWPVGVTVTR